MSWLMAVLGNWGIGSGLLSAPRVVKIPEHLGLMACERLMGMILVMLSLQMLLDGISN